MFIFFVISLAFAQEKKCPTDNEFLYEGVCVGCSELCAGTCVDNLGCENRTCIPGYYFTKPSCSPCPEGCSVCEDSETCTTCFGDYYSMQGMCYPKPNNCLKTTPEVGCSECNETFFLSNVTNGQCGTCGVGCGECDPTNTIGCQAVKVDNNDISQGYYIVSGISYQCSDQCAICYDSTSIDKKEQPSSDADKELLSNAKPGCIKCKDGFFAVRDASGLTDCMECDPICETCEGSAGNCLSCKKFDNEKYYLYNVATENGTMQSCRPKQENCKKFECKDKNNCEDNNNCEECAEGYYLEDKTCYIKDAMCKEYVKIPDTKNYKCKSCEDDYILKDKHCVRVTDNCQEFDKDDQTKCKKCNDFYYLSGNFCLPCDLHCVNCNGASGICIECSSGYYSNGTKTCLAEEVSGDKVTPLWAIGNNTHPERCNENYYVNYYRSPQTCRQCSEFCAVEYVEYVQPEETNPTTGRLNFTDTIDYCDTAFGCTKCDPGFYVSPDGECSSCPVHCAYCDQTLGCLHCLGDAVMKDGRCPYSGASSLLTLLIVLILAFAI